jgi:hypothetical protein
VLRPPLATLLPRTLHGLPKAFIGEGFEQVIERAELKRFERVLIVSSDKNQRRRALCNCASNAFASSSPARAWRYVSSAMPAPRIAQ